MSLLGIKLTLISIIITNIHFTAFADDCEPYGYCTDPTIDITCGLTRDCTILCDHMGSCNGRMFTFLNDWGQTKGKYKATLICRDYGACDNIIIIANTSLLYLNFEGNDQSSMEAYINFGSYSNTQYAYINCNGSYSCNSASFVFNSMMDADIQSNDMVNIGCNDAGSCKQMVITAFQAYNVHLDCIGYESCHELCIYSPIKTLLNNDKNTYVNCDSISTENANEINNSSYDGDTSYAYACKNMRIYNYGGKYLTNINCIDNICDIELHCGFMYEYNCNYMNCTEKHCNALINEYIIKPNNNQLIVSPNKLIMDYTKNNTFTNKEIYIYISTLYEKFIYFYNRKDINLYNESYPIIYCPINGICNIICVDIGYGTTFDHCSYGIYYGNYSLEMNIRGYKAINSKWYGAINSFYWNGKTGNKNINLYLEYTNKNVLFDCNGTNDLYTYSNIKQWGCYQFNIYLNTLNVFEMNCLTTSSCYGTQIYTHMGKYNKFPKEFKLNCNKSEHTSCREMDIYFDDKSGCEYAITNTNLTYFYWDCIHWYSDMPTISPTQKPTIGMPTVSHTNIPTVSMPTISPTKIPTVNLHESNGNGFIIPLIVVICILFVAIIVYFILKKFGKRPLSSFMVNRRTRNHAHSQSFVGLNDLSNSRSN